MWDEQPIVSVSGICASRCMTEVFGGGSSRTYSLPPTAVSVCEDAFSDQQSLASVRLNEGLRVLEYYCFKRTGIRRLALPASVREIHAYAFEQCRLAQADLSAARGLKSLTRGVFSECGELRRAVLNEGLESIGMFCFAESALEQVNVPRSVRHIEGGAFSGCMSLRQVRFEGSALEDIGTEAFKGSGLESFTAPASLCRIYAKAFAHCRSLRRVDLGACLLRSSGRKN